MNCKSCGAPPKTTACCEYCGTMMYLPRPTSVLYDPAILSSEEATSISVGRPGQNIPIDARAGDSFVFVNTLRGIDGLMFNGSATQSQIRAALEAGYVSGTETMSTVKPKETGRYYIVDMKTGRKFLVEPIGKPRTEFGDSLDNFCSASIQERDSIITKDAGFTDIGYAQNPMDYIERVLNK